MIFFFYYARNRLHMNKEKAIIEAALFISSEPVAVKKLLEITGLEKNDILQLLEELKLEFITRGSGIEIYSDENSYGMRIHGHIEESVLHLAPETDMPKAMLKTLALIAVEQPIKQSDLVKIRGNRTYDYIKKLLNLEFITATRQGHTKILETTPKFREYFRIDDVENLKPQ